MTESCGTRGGLHAFATIPGERSGIISQKWPLLSCQCRRVPNLWQLFFIKSPLSQSISLHAIMFQMSVVYCSHITLKYTCYTTSWVYEQLSMPN